MSVVCERADMRGSAPAKPGREVILVRSYHQVGEVSGEAF